MTINLETEYGARANPADSDYPFGSFKNESVQGSDDGTPIEVAWGNDMLGFFQALLDRASITPSNSPDTAPESQTLAALLKNLSDTAPPQASPNALCEGLPNAVDKWHDPAAFPNTLTTGVAIRDACLGWGTDTRPFLWVSHGDDSIAKLTGCWDYEGAPALAAAVSPSYPSTPDMVLAICCDSDYLYIAWCATAGDIQVTKFDAATLAEVWTCDTGVTSSAYEDRIRLIVANTSNLAILLPGNCDDGTVGYGVAIITKSDGTIYPKTSVAAGVGVSFVPESGALVSDGTAVYFLWLDNVGGGTRDYTLSRTVIATRTNTNTLIRQVTVPNWGTYPGGLVAVSAGRILIPCCNGEVDLYDDGTVYNQFDIDATAWDGVGASEYGLPVGFDGLNVWLGFLLYGEQPAGYHRLVKAPASVCAPVLGATPPASHPVISPSFVALEADTRPANAWPGNMVFDGRDMWLVHPDGHVYRLTAPGMR
ncbi:hypothetical protein M0R36_10905 [bacterium]|jgi:hypothetical protein|nr:hypothetical protein [bacterium]